MDNLLIYTVGTVIVALLIFFVLKYKKEGQEKDNLGESTDFETFSKSETTLLKDRALEISTIDQFILQNSLGNELVFDRPNELSEKKYQEVSLSKGGRLANHATQAAIPVIERTTTITELKEKAPYGLFTATTDPANLSKFSKDNSYSTMTRNQKGIKEHKGFIKKDINELVQSENILSAVNAGMQASAAISGQYYLEKITSQLEVIESKIEELIDFHHDKRLAILKNAKHRLEEIINKENVDHNDIIEIRSLRNSVREVFEEYRTRLNRKVGEVSQYQSKSLFVEKRVADYVKEIEKVQFNTHVSYEADKLSIQAELAEISVRMKLDYSDPILQDLYNQLKNNIENSFSMNIDQSLLDIFRPIDMHADNIIKDGKNLFIIEKDRKKLMQSIFNISKEMESEFNPEPIKNLVNNSINERREPKEILILPNSEAGEQKVYIPVKE